MDKKIKNELGTITITPEVIATISGIAAMECYGVVGMVSRRVKDGLSELLGRDNLKKGVEVEIKDNKVNIELYIMVQYGTKISEVAHNVMDKVKYTLENYLGLKNTNVKVIVQSVKVK